MSENGPWPRRAARMTARFSVVRSTQNQPRRTPANRTMRLITSIVARARRSPGVNPDDRVTGKR
jgi:hypothetical protein